MSLGVYCGCPRQVERTPDKLMAGRARVREDGQVGGAGRAAHLPCKGSEATHSPGLQALSVTGDNENDYVDYIHVMGRWRQSIMSLTWRERAGAWMRDSRTWTAEWGPQWESGPSAGDRRRCRVVGQCHQGKTGLQTGQDQEGGCILQKAQENVFLLTPIFLTGF